jgi:hypothetical protein
MVRVMSQIFCLSNEPAEEPECLCYDNKPCDIHIDDGGNLVCRYGSNEGEINGFAKVVCPLEIETERKKWESFLNQEIERNFTEK